jgi:hypothetical protein
MSTCPSLPPAQKRPRPICLGTQALVPCDGVAVAVAYVSEPTTGEERLDKFPAHLDEDDSEAAAEALKEHIEEAKRRGLRNLYVLACALDFLTLRERLEEPVGEGTVQQQVSFNEQCISPAADSTKGVRSSPLMVIKHHIYEPKNKAITSENEIMVDNYN